MLTIIEENRRWELLFQNLSGGLTEKEQAELTALDSNLPQGNRNRLECKLVSQETEISQ